MVAVFLLGAEWACRSMETSLGQSLFVPPLYPADKFNAFLPYQWIRLGATTSTTWSDGTNAYRFNQWNLRGDALALETPLDVRRVLLLGGSKVFGVGVSESQTLARRLEARLNQKRSKGWQVINGGLWALSPQQQGVWLERQGLRFRPQTVVWLCESRSAGTPDDEGLKRLVASRGKLTGLLVHSRLVRLIVNRKIQGPPASPPSSKDPLFAQVERLCRENNVTLIQKFVSSPAQGVPPGEDPQRWFVFSSSFPDDSVVDSLVGEILP